MRYNQLGSVADLLSRGAPDFHFWRKCDARDKPYRAGTAGWGLNSPSTGARSDDDAVLLRSKANSGRTGPRGNARRDSNPQTHSPYRGGGKADRSPRLSPDWRGEGGIRRIGRRDAHVRCDGLELRLRRLPFRYRLAEQSRQEFPA